MIKINLVPKEIQDRGKGSEWLVLGGVGMGIFALLGVASYLVKLNHYQMDLKRRERWTQQLNDIKTKVAQVEQLDAQKAQLNAKRSTVIQLLQGRLLYAKLMESFFESLPKDVWVTDLKLSEDPQKNVKIDATSNSLTVDAIADWLQTLESKPERFSGVNLSAIEVKAAADPKQPPTYGFTMTFTYLPPAKV